ncbi:MAG: YihY/virulence factor BrkB family protein [Gemmatimonadota bacterium]
MTRRGGSLPQRLRHFVADVYNRAADDNIFFLASGLTFGVLLAAIPFLLLLIYVASLVLSPYFGPGVAEDEVLEALWRIMPVTSPEVIETARAYISQIIASAGSIGLIGGILFVWFSTRLFGALRTALNQVFDLKDTRGIVRGKIGDMQMVVVSTLLLSVNIAVTSTMKVLGDRGIQFLGQLGLRAGSPQKAFAFLTAFTFVFLMFLLIYKYVPARRLPWRTAIIASLFAATTFELLKMGFSWWVANYANYSAVFFAFATLVVLIISSYYASILFVLGGEVAQVYEVRRKLRRQREFFD